MAGRTADRNLERVEVTVTAEEIKRYEVGKNVTMHGTDSNGVHQTAKCTVAGLPGRKFLTFRDAAGKIKKCAIKNYLGKYYTKEVSMWKN